MCAGAESAGGAPLDKIPWSCIRYGVYAGRKQVEARGASARVASVWPALFCSSSCADYVAGTSVIMYRGYSGSPVRYVPLGCVCHSLTRLLCLDEIGGLEQHREVDGLHAHDTTMQ